MPLKGRWVRFVAVLIVCGLASQSRVAQLAQADATSDKEGLKPVLSYISSAWDTLTRSMTRCDSFGDPKLNTQSVLYLPADFGASSQIQTLQQDCKIQVEHLPAPIRHPGQLDPAKLNPPGLLFLENSYVVPGGRFNEMYGWDSYFIIRGLLQDGRVELARGMVENFFFELDHYGSVLNANRTYFLTRSQPPFLTSMILAVYEADKAAGHDDLQWLRKAYQHAIQDYDLWVHEPHLAGSTGLSRYYDFGEGPVPEGLQDENGYYHSAVAYYLNHPQVAEHELVDVKSGQKGQDVVGFTFPLQLCEQSQDSLSKCEIVKTLALTRDFYKGDRAMRESGFDVSFRFGPFSAETHHYAPVCLNSLLYKTEKDLEFIGQLLGQKEDSAKWRKRADDRRERITKYLWDGEHGLFVDYDFVTQSKSSYPYITTFYPLWAGVAAQEQATTLLRKLPLFEQPGGLAESRYESGAQWDYPYGWAPTTLLAVEGLRRYGFTADADRIAYKFLSMVAEDFRRQGTMLEKYNVVKRSSETHVSEGYKQNVVGFGWTNATFLVLLHSLPPDMVQKLAKEQAQAAAAN
ncbi:MAG TPA: trehalase family glycosidase [Terriglobales bacterium]|nr:trehalase family glycosidase [Terriglobales bacterium]